jgi:hypothetical protein
MLKPFILAIVLFLISCQEEPRPVVVTYQLTHQADTTFLRQYKDSIQSEMDSFCTRNYDALYSHIRDSILRDEIGKMEKLTSAN